MDGDFEHCRKLLARADNDRYLATLFAPAQHRGALFALFAFNAEIAGVANHIRDPMAGEIRLQWWREAISGAREGEAAANPLAAALIQVLRIYNISTTPLIALIDAHAFDLYGEPMASVLALEDFARSTEVNMLTLAAAILGTGDAASDTKSDTLCEQAGLALGFALVLRRFANDAARRRLFLPADITGHHHAYADGIFAGHASAELLAALADMRRRTRHYLDGAAARLADAPAAMLPALLPAALVRSRLARMELAGFDPFALSDLSAAKRQWLLWRASRNSRRIFG